jgi:transposase
MMGQQPRMESLFYYFRLEDQIPEDHLLRLIDRYVDFSFVRERLKGFYSPTGRPSIDPEVLLRLLLVGYLYGITSERRLMDEVRMNLAYRWFTRLDFSQEIPDHSTFSKNRHGRFRQSGVFREVFEEIVRRCLEAGLVEGRNLTVDGTLVGANASQRSRVPREQLAEAGQLSRTVQQYLTELEQQNPVPESEEPPPSGPVSTTDPDAAWTAAKGRARVAGLLRQLPHGHSQPGDPGGGGHTRTLPARDGGRPADAAASREAGAAPGVSGGRQGLWQRRVSGLGAGAEHSTPHSVL